MTIFRVSSCRYIHDMSGTGGLYAAGRWHYKGTRILYFSEHISLAKLEVLASSTFLPKKMCLLSIELHSDVSIKTLNPNDIPHDWQLYPHPDILKKITHEWIGKTESFLLKVPSAQSTSEYNYLLNPLHPEMDKVKTKRVESISFDRRLKLSYD
ncbi:MAG: RES family NAD+ phosphorylase [Bacteroidota bacterium]